MMSLFSFGERIFFVSKNKSGETVLHSMKNDGSEHSEHSAGPNAIFFHGEGERLYYLESMQETKTLFSCKADLSDIKQEKKWVAGSFTGNLYNVLIQDGYLYYTTSPKTETKNGLQIVTACLTRAPLSDLSDPQKEEVLLSGIQPLMGNAAEGKLFYGKGEEALPSTDALTLPAFRHLYVFDLATGTETKICSQEGEAGYRFDLTAFSPEYALFSAREKENSMASQYLLVPMT